MRYLDLEPFCIVFWSDRNGSSLRYIPPEKERCNVGVQHFGAIVIYEGGEFLVAAQQLHQNHRVPSRGVDPGGFQDRRFPDAVLACEECHAPEPRNGKVIDSPKSAYGQIGEVQSVI